MDVIRITRFFSFLFFSLTMLVASAADASGNMGSLGNSSSSSGGPVNLVADAILNGFFMVLYPFQTVLEIISKTILG